MTQDDRNYVNAILAAAAAVIDAPNTYIDPTLLNALRDALKQYDRYELIKTYKEQERALYSKNRDMYNTIKAARIALELDTPTVNR